MLLAAFRAGAAGIGGAVRPPHCRRSTDTRAWRTRTGSPGRGARPGSAQRPRVPGRRRAMGPGRRGGHGGAAAGGNARISVGRGVPEGGPFASTVGRPPDGVRRRAGRGDRSSARAHALVARPPVPGRPARRVEAGTLDAVWLRPPTSGRAPPRRGSRSACTSRSSPRRRSPTTIGRSCQHLGPGDIVAVVRSRESVAWANNDLGPRGRRCGSPGTGEPPTRSSWPVRSRPWPTSSRRRGMRSNGGLRSGSPRASTWEPMTSSWPGARRPPRGGHRRVARPADPGRALRAAVRQVFPRNAAPVRNRLLRRIQHRGVHCSGRGTLI